MTDLPTDRDDFTALEVPLMPPAPAAPAAPTAPPISPDSPTPAAPAALSESDVESILKELRSNGLVPYSLGVTGRGFQLMLAPKEQIDTGCINLACYTSSIPIDEKIARTITLYRNESNDLNDSNIISPRRLTMFCINDCDFCNSPIAGTVNIVSICHLLGWFVCNACYSNPECFRANFIEYLNKTNTIPMQFLFDDDSKWFHNNAVILKFWRKTTESVQVTKMCHGNGWVTMYSTDDNGLDFQALYSDFYDKDLERDPTKALHIVMDKDTIDTYTEGTSDESMSVRCVSLENLFYYNPGLYADIITEPNLMEKNSPFTISLNDLSPDNKKYLDNLFAEAMKNGPKFDF